MKHYTYEGINYLVDSYNENFKDCSSYPQIKNVTYGYDDNDGCCDIYIEFERPIEEERKDYVLMKLFSDYVSDINFEELLECSWFGDSDDIISFWYGRLDNIGIDSDLNDLGDLDD